MATELAGAVRALVSLCPLPTTNEAEMRKLTRQGGEWKNEAAVAGTTAIAERPVTRARQRSRLVTATLTSATTTAANATNYLSVILRKRTAALPGTQVPLVTFAMDTPTTDDLTAFAGKDLLGYIDGAQSAFDFEEGDTLTVEVTKTGGSGLAYPIGELNVTFEPRT